MGWATEGPKTNPDNGEILADTGALSLGINAAIIIETNVDVGVELVRRNAANSSDVKVQPIAASAPTTFFQTIPFTLSTGERILLRVPTGVEGTVHASILW